MSTAAESAQVGAADAEHSLFDPQRTKRITGVRIFDVGQGDCIGLLDQHGEVAAYVDYGGYLDHPDANSPGNTATRLPAVVRGRKVPIILTHWDQDHIYSAHRYNSQAQHSRWLVPRQWVSPFAAKLAARLRHARCWPETLGHSVACWAVGNQVVEIRKCRPFRRHAPKEDRNLSGLAITILDRAGSRAQMQIVLPGDCPFDRIPGVKPVPIRHLVAYHHGARTHWNLATTKFLQLRARRWSLSYSYSAQNSYGHPVRSKYRPHWDRRGSTTVSARKRGAQYIDVRW